MSEFIYQLFTRAGIGLFAMLPGILVYLCIDRLRGRKTSIIYMIGILVFSYYLMGVLTVTGISSIQEFSPRISLIPFIDIIPSLMQSILNVILFVPLGFLLPVIFIKSEKFSHVIIIGFLFSLSIEIIQMFGFGATDVNDLITNTFGTIVGYGLWKSIFANNKQSLKVNHKDAKVELVALMIYGWIVMLTIQPWMINQVGAMLNLE